MPIDNGKDRIQSNSYKHALDVNDIRLSPEEGGMGKQMCALLDKNSDLFLVLVHSLDIIGVRSIKLSSMIKDFSWHQDCNVLASLRDNSTVNVWIHPYCAYIDSSLMQDIVVNLINNEATPKQSRIQDFESNTIVIRRFDSVKVYIAISPFITLLHHYEIKGQWQEAVKMCNFLDKSASEVQLMDRNLCTALWASLAVMSLSARQFATAEIAYAAIDKLDKVLYLNKLKSIESNEIRGAELELMSGNHAKIERFLSQNGYFLRLVLLYIEAFDWLKALEISQQYSSKFGVLRVKHSTKVPCQDDSGDTNQESHSISETTNIDLIHLVISSRQHYLQIKKKQEHLKQFIQINNQVNRMMEVSSLKKSFSQIDNVLDWPIIENYLNQNSQVIYTKH